MITLWHNPRCSKSRQTLALIEAAGVEATFRRYLEDAPTRDEVIAARDRFRTDAVARFLHKSTEPHPHLIGTLVLSVQRQKSTVGGSRVLIYSAQPEGLGHKESGGCGLFTPIIRQGSYGFGDPDKGTI